jgi:small neutral amino acid transporter SnatA (MarC family)
VDSASFDVYTIVDIFLLLLIGVGPKIALVPFVELTAGMEPGTKAGVLRKMLTTAAVVSILLLLLGGLLSRLLHFSTGALSVASGLILVILAIGMVRGPANDEPGQHHTGDQDPLETAVYPLAVPYLLNPAGIVVLVTASADAASVGHIAIVFVLVAAVFAVNVVVFRWANRVSDHLDQSRMLITEKVFGFLLAALAVQLMLNGLDAVGAIHLTGH